jgi:hypothetical protein
MQKSSEQRLRDLVNRSSLTAAFSVLFTLVGFSYNVWRMEQTERNSNLRTSCFQMLLELAEFEQVVFSLHYDRERMTTTPRMGWVKARLLHDLGTIATPAIQARSDALLEVWQQQWPLVETEDAAAEKVIDAIDAAREAVREQFRLLR